MKGVAAIISCCLRRNKGKIKQLVNVKKQKVMEDYGTVSSVKFIMDRATGRFRGIAFVEMEDSAAAAKAISELDGAEFFGRQMVVKEARPPKY